MNSTSSNSGGQNSGHSAKIMVVDDDVRLRDLLRRYLTEQGFQVVTAESAPEPSAKDADAKPKRAKKEKKEPSAKDAAKETTKEAAKEE